MIEITFEINGRKVNPNRIGDALEAAVLDSVRKQIIDKVSSIRDPLTGEQPKIKVKGRTLSNLTFEITGSEELVRQVREKLA